MQLSWIFDIDPTALAIAAAAISGVVLLVVSLLYVQAIHLAVVEAFEREGIEFAYPTRTLFLQPPAALSPAA